MSRFLTTNTYISPTKEQIQSAITKVERAYELYKPIDNRLKMDVVEVPKWLGLSKDILTKDEHIRKKNKNSLFPYFLRALLLGYVTIEQADVCTFVMEAPSLKTLREWAAADQVYLDEWDHDKLIYAITQEFE